ncbi:hypothetical protein ACWF9G_24875 [Nocardia sp. NPDC055029]
MPSTTDAFFNIQETAGFYSQLAGVLAGFSFAALMLLMTARLAPAASGSSQAGASNFGAAVRILIISFLGLVLTSLDYALLAGEIAGRHRANTLEIVGGVSFAIAALLLVYAIILTIDAVNTAVAQPDSELESVAKTLRGTLALVLVPLSLMLIYNGIQDYNFAKYGHPRTTSLDYVTWSLIAVQVLAGTPLYFLLLAKGPTSSRIKEIKIVSYVAFIALLVISIVYSVIIAAITDGGLGSPLIPYLCIVSSSVLAFLFVIHLARTHT